MECDIIINGAAGSEEVHTTGDLQYDEEGFSLMYGISGDMCLMTCRNKTITQTRRGRVQTDITFAEGKQTVCMLLSGELTGSIPVDTSIVSIDKSPARLQVYLRYMLGGARIDLTLIATARKEEV